jgi:serine-type D-Ala-D-Ala carboxypeptidase (penicillin-binding protein 5/6)
MERQSASGTRRHQSARNQPRNTHLTGLILTGALLLGLVGTLGLTFASALSASSNKSGSPRSVAAANSTATEAPTEAAKTPTATPTEEPTAEPTARPADAPPISAETAFAIDAGSGAALIALNADERRPMASLTKLVSALVVARAIHDGLISLADSVEIEESDLVDETVYSHMGLVAGDTLTVEQLLQGMLIPSGNDAAKALARYVGTLLPDGEEDPTVSFVAAMNDVVAELGLNNTHFEAPDGDDDESNYSTAHDLAYIGREVMNSRLLSRIVAVPQVTITSVGKKHREYELVNTNHLLAAPGFDGIKTGTTDGAGACLVASSVLEDGRRVIVVVLGSTPDPEDFDGDPIEWPRFADAQAIINQIAAEA